MLIVPVPSTVVPSRKVTVSPAGVKGLIAAVKVTACPKGEGSADGLTATAVPAGVYLWGAVTARVLYVVAGRPPGVVGAGPPPRCIGGGVGRVTGEPPA